MFRGDASNSYEQQAKFIQDRINTVEKYFGELCLAFTGYARKTARLRDKGDDLAEVLKEYASHETVNKSLSVNLENLSLTLSALEEYRNCAVQRMEAKVIGELSQYETICKHAREELKHTMSVRDKELSRKKVLDKSRERQPFNRQQVAYAESELLKASAEMSRTAKGLSEQTDFFERRKLQQLKSLLSDFIMIEMTFHAKAVELLTIAYQRVDEINEKADLEHNTGLSDTEEPVNFRRKLRSPENVAGSGMSARSASLGAFKTSNTSPNKEDGDIMRTPEKLRSEMARSSSLQVLASKMTVSDSEDEETSSD
ncbi:CBY1-interacting BAR domain-containing protein 1-A isoform X1 [Plutella xylostella]|uniref:CBY1-interacting BAR domain-containing protein 1-A isoform X1 n=1 Tax=Plutella xylostella TaxID=51655 RepID=UPI002032B091|nr:CBY1-interacting BAR domain-containing protein 1-A isoform X1 [Plutella xylostella]